jgi:hypothetical protein
MSVETASDENSDAEARNESTSTSPAAYDPRTPPPVADETSEDEWEAVEIIGDEIINSKLHYTVEWKPTRTGSWSFQKGYKESRTRKEEYQQGLYKTPL